MICANHWFILGSCYMVIMHACWHRMELCSLTVSVQQLQKRVVIFKSQVNDYSRTDMCGSLFLEADLVW